MRRRCRATTRHRVCTAPPIPSGRGGQPARVRHRIGHRLAGHPSEPSSSAPPPPRCAPPLRRSGPPSTPSSSPGPQHGAAAQDRHAERLEHGLAQLARSAGSAGSRTPRAANRSRYGGFPSWCRWRRGAGSASASRTVTRTPRRASASATAAPTTPAPITATSASTAGDPNGPVWEGATTCPKVLLDFVAVVTLECPRFRRQVGQTFRPARSAARATKGPDSRGIRMSEGGGKIPPGRAAPGRTRVQAGAEPRLVALLELRDLVLDHLRAGRLLHGLRAGVAIRRADRHLLGAGRSSPSSS